MALSRTPDGYRASPLRLLLIVMCVVGLTLGATWWAYASWTSFTDGRDRAQSIWAAPYVDATLLPILHFEEPTEQPSANTVLGFIVADPSEPCRPSWGTYYSLDAAARALDLDRRMARFRERGGDVAVSFGGAANRELATACEDVDRLSAAYQAVIDRYQLTMIDFDLEGASLADAPAISRRTQAIQQLQRANRDLRVWLTLPVTPDGMTPPTVALVEQTLAARVDLAGVNLMTMNYGRSRSASSTMRDANVAALRATWAQLDAIYRANGDSRQEREIWALMGATPMIGQNDTTEDVLTIADADALIAFALKVHLGRLSFWSANRDAPCGAAGTVDSRVSNRCSGVSQEPLGFGYRFAAHPSATSRRPSTGDLAQREQTSGAEGRSGDLAGDEPRTNPYPLWRGTRPYTGGVKVVWQNKVYQAKWYTEGDRPDAPVAHVWETPWRYLGPVLDSDRVAVRAARPTADGRRPRWDSEAVYVAGDEVEYNRGAFRARWWTQGEPPQEDADRAYDHPWEYLGEVELRKVAVGDDSRIGDAEALVEIESRLAKALREQDRGEFLAIHVFPPTGASVPDDSAARLVVLSPSTPYGDGGEESGALAAARDILEHQGTEPRRYQNSLVFAAAGADEVTALVDAARQYLAAKDVFEATREPGVSTKQHEDARATLSRTETDLSARIDAAYQWLLIPDQRPGGPVDWKAARISRNPRDSLTPLAVRASSYLVQEQLLFRRWSPAALNRELNRYVWRDGRREISVRELWDLFAANLYLPRLRDPQTLLDAIRDGTTTTDYFGYATSKNADGGFAGLAFGRGTNGVYLDDLAVVIRPDVAAVAAAPVRGEAAASG